jgi:tetratricopeptide (TPR) repeat protein
MQLQVGIALCVIIATPLCGCVHSSSGDDDVIAGARLYEQRKYGEAAERLERAVNKPLKNYSKCHVLTVLGNCYNELEDYEKALSYHDAAIDEDPSSHEAHVNKGVVHRLMGDHDKAAECYEKAVALNPNYAEAHASLGALALLRDEPDKAIECLERAAKLDPSVSVAHSNLALAYASVGRFDDAEAALRRATLHGYHKPEAIRERIDNLRRLQERESK